MHAKTVLSLAVGTLILLASAAIIWVPLVPLAPKLKEAAVNLAAVDNLARTGVPLAVDGQQATSPTSADGELLARVAALEKSMEQLNLVTRAINELQNRVDRLEQSATRSHSNDIAQLKRETASLKQAYDHLATRVAMVPASPSGLEQKVYTLESTVRRLESGR